MARLISTDRVSAVKPAVNRKLTGIFHFFSPTAINIIALYSRTVLTSFITQIYFFDSCCFFYRHLIHHEHTFALILSILDDFCFKSVDNMPTHSVSCHCHCHCHYSKINDHQKPWTTVVTKKRVYLQNIPNPEYSSPHGGDQQSGCRWKHSCHTTPHPPSC